MIIHVATQPVEGSTTDSAGVVWRYKVKPMLNADVHVATVSDPTTAAAAAWALVGLVSATAPDGKPVGVKVDGAEEAKAVGDLPLDVQLRLVRGFNELAVGIFTTAREAGLRVEDERGN